jgi:tripartite-type tricarboxylate transporter receptor subunit TctC
MKTTDTTRRQVLAAGGAATLGAALPRIASAQSDWPNKPLRFIVPFPAGGGADLGARVLSVHLGNALGKPVLVENRAGADGVVAAQEVMRSAPDGHTLFFATASSLSYVPNLKKTPPYDPITDFTPIANMVLFSFFLTVAPSIPANTLAEFIAYVKANPGKISYGSGNSSSILAMGQLIEANGLQMNHVPYKGEGQAVIDLVGGRVPAMWVSPAVLPQMLKEKFKPLAVLLPQRSRTYPQVPTVAEAGQPLINIAPWGGCFGPKGMPREIVDRLSREINLALRKPEVVEQFDKLGLLLVPSTPEVLGTLVKDQLGIFGNVMRSVGIQPE